MSKHIYSTAINTASNLRFHWLYLFLLTTVSSTPAVSVCQSNNPYENSLANKIDAFIDARFDGTDDDTAKLISDLKLAGKSKLVDMENLLRGRRAQYPDPKEWIGKTTQHNVECLHVDYSSSFYMFVPMEVDLDKPVALVVVGHGGNSSMSAKRSSDTAKAYIHLYSKGIAKNFNAVIIAPASERGWGQIGNSLILSSISKVKRMLPIDPDRIYITGQSMGGHLAYRSALTLPDRWGAVSPHSGGYNFVEKKTIENLINVPGYSVWGIREPYGINKDNRINQQWAKANDLPWVFVEKNGGHEIYHDELPHVAKFFKDNPRDLYRDSVYLRASGDMKFVNNWKIKNWPKHTIHHDTKPLRWNIRHWLEVKPRPEFEEPLVILANHNGKNRFELISTHVQQCSIYLHPNMVDFSKPIVVVANGKRIFKDKVTPDPKIMFNLAREFDDRGRVYWAKVDLQISTGNQSIP